MREGELWILVEKLGNEEANKLIKDACRDAKKTKSKRS